MAGRCCGGRWHVAFAEFRHPSTTAPRPSYLVRDIEALGIEGGHEVVLVNDGSADQTSIVCRDLVRTSRIPITLVEHARNFGEHNAVLTGWRHARALSSSTSMTMGRIRRLSGEAVGARAA